MSDELKKELQEEINDYNYGHVQDLVRLKALKRIEELEKEVDDWKHVANDMCNLGISLAEELKRWIRIVKLINRTEEMEGPTNVQ